VAVSRFERVKRSLAKAVRRRRQELGLTQEEAAHALELATRHYQKLEAAELNITLRTLTRVVAFFDLDLAVIFGGS
jgi:transcriptional regulator with XRE-family HTH domain